MSQENDHDFRDQHKILVLEMLTNPCGGLVTKILLHSVISQRRIQEDLDSLEVYCNLWKLKINSTKTVYSALL